MFFSPISFNRQCWGPTGRDFFLSFTVFIVPRTVPSAWKTSNRYALNKFYSIFKFLILKPTSEIIIYNLFFSEA